MKSRKPASPRTPFNAYREKVEEKGLGKSSWLEWGKREGFTKFMAEKHLPRMSQSKEGKRKLDGGGAKEFV